MSQRWHTDVSLLRLWRKIICWTQGVWWDVCSSVSTAVPLWLRLTWVNILHGKKMGIIAKARIKRKMCNYISAMPLEDKSHRSYEVTQGHILQHLSHKTTTCSSTSHKCKHNKLEGELHGLTHRSVNVPVCECDDADVAVLTLPTNWSYNKTVYWQGLGICRFTYSMAEPSCWDLMMLFDTKRKLTLNPKWSRLHVRRSQ